jgi:hypothetical protein
MCGCEQYKNINYQCLGKMSLENHVGLKRMKPFIILLIEELSYLRRSNTVRLVRNRYLQLAGNMAKMERKEMHTQSW